MVDASLYVTVHMENVALLIQIFQILANMFAEKILVARKIAKIGK